MRPAAMRYLGVDALLQGVTHYRRRGGVRPAPQCAASSHQTAGGTHPHPQRRRVGEQRVRAVRRGRAVPRDGCKHQHEHERLWITGNATRQGERRTASRRQEGARRRLDPARHGAPAGSGREEQPGQVAQVLEMGAAHPLPVAVPGWAGAPQPEHRHGGSGQGAGRGERGGKSDIICKLVEDAPSAAARIAPGLWWCGGGGR